MRQGLGVALLVKAIRNLCSTTKVLPPLKPLNVTKSQVPNAEWGQARLKHRTAGSVCTSPPGTVHAGAGEVVFHPRALDTQIKGMLHHRMV